MQCKMIIKVATAVCILATTFTAGIYASEGLTKVEAFLRGDFIIKVNGEATEFSSPPLVYQNKTYLPVADVGEALKVDVEWDGPTKTIYINPRLYEIQPDVESSELGEIEISLLKGMNATYMGRDYSILVNDTYGGKRYLREKDMKRMGVNTSGLVRVQEKWTQEIYIAEEEAKKAWKEQPTITYSYNSRTAVTESNEEKADVLRSFRPWNPLIPGLPVIDEEEEETYYYSRSQTQFDMGTLYSVDPIPGEENTYLALFFHDNKYYHYTLTLTPHEVNKSSGGKSVKETEWYVSKYSSEILYDVEEQYRKDYFPY